MSTTKLVRAVELQARWLPCPQEWLSYRERKILDRALLPEEVQHFTDTARRIAAVLLATNAAGVVASEEEIASVE